MKKINDILSNPIILDICVIGWFISMISGIIIEAHFKWFDYLFSFIFVIYLISRIIHFIKPSEDETK